MLLLSAVWRQSSVSRLFPLHAHQNARQGVFQDNGEIVCRFFRIMSVFVCEFIDEESRHGLGIEVCQKFLELLLRMDAQPPLGALNNPSCDADKICVEKADG